jgi:hypothetical protein
MAWADKSHGAPKRTPAKQAPPGSMKPRNTDFALLRQEAPIKTRGQPKWEIALHIPAGTRRYAQANREQGLNIKCGS